MEKLIRRHPHVFGDVQVSGTDEVLANWEAIKRAERAAKSGAANGDAAQKRSPLAGIPKGLPALAQAEAYLDRMARPREFAVHDAPGRSWPALAADDPLTPELVGEALFDLVAWSRARAWNRKARCGTTNARYAARVAVEEWG